MSRRSKEEVESMAVTRNAGVQDHVALVEIDLAGELMIAAAAASEDRLSRDRIDELLDVGCCGRRARQGGWPAGQS
ncbi:hypothetical protein ACIBK8_30560 [Streptomyces sp. NPDC050161]|uniref:hypothetical protein n=1 Tax=Streptomyces sp. NPDC050161 TaxID=3365604 RepID=UPI0037946664